MFQGPKIIAKYNKAQAARALVVGTLLWRPTRKTFWLIEKKGRLTKSGSEVFTLRSVKDYQLVEYHSLTFLCENYCIASFPDEVA